MDAPTSPPRPRQVTLAAWLIMVGSALVVLTVFDRIAGLHTLESQEAVERFLSEPPGDDLGLGVQGVLNVIRTVAMVAGGCATAAAILGYQVLHRSRSARIALTVLAVPLFVTGMVTGGFMSSVVVASAAMLWFQPARDWFNGVTREPAPSRGSAAGPAATPGAEAGAGAGAGADAPRPPSGPRAVPGFGAPASEPTLTAQVRPDARPATVTWACALTWVFATLAILVMAASMALLASNPGLVFDELRTQNPELARQGVSDHLVTTLTYVIGGVVIVWSLGAVVLAALVFRRVAWARVALVVSAAGSAGLCLVAAVGQPLMVIPLAASVATLALLVRPDSRAWF